jgi:hypothetical protein
MIVQIISVAIAVNTLGMNDTLLLPGSGRQQLYLVLSVDTIVTVKNYFSGLFFSFLITGTLAHLTVECRNW